jgi:hypothetical protein
MDKSSDCVQPKDIDHLLRSAFALDWRHWVGGQAWDA